jgi:FKBP-type peptidyl-prolyl cis-trans isomerase FklB
MELKNDKEKMSYALGINLAQSLTQLPIEVEPEAVAQALKDVLSNGELALDQEGYAAQIQAVQAKVQAAQEEAVDSLFEDNDAQASDFLAVNSQKDDVKSTDSGLQYTVMVEGDGAKPKASDTVKVHYTGTLIDGTVFDSSVERGTPAEFGVGQVIKGWTEALQLMSVGSKYKLFIPSELAYGKRGAGQLIGPGAMLIFEVELLEIL